MVSLSDFTPTFNGKWLLMSNDIRLEKLTRLGIALMQEEKERALRADFEGLAEIEPRKIEFLSQLEEIAQTVDKAGPSPIRAARRDEIATLFDIMRRRAEENQYILKAAAAGVRSAGKQLQALSEASRSLGVYDPDGEQVRRSDAENATTGGVF